MIFSLLEPNVAVSITLEEREPDCTMCCMLTSKSALVIQRKQNRTTQIFNMTSPLTRVNLKNVTHRKNWLSVVMKNYVIWLNMWMVN